MSIYKRYNRRMKQQYMHIELPRSCHTMLRDSDSQIAKRNGKIHDTVESTYTNHIINILRHLFFKSLSNSFHGFFVGQFWLFIPDFPSFLKQYVTYQLARWRPWALEFLLVRPTLEYLSNFSSNSASFKKSVRIGFSLLLSGKSTYLI